MRPADLQQLASPGAQPGLAAGHRGGVAEHEDADEGVAVFVPVHDGRRGAGAGAGGHGDVDVRDLVFHVWDQGYPGDRGDYSEGFGVGPCVVYEFGISFFGNRIVSVVS